MNYFNIVAAPYIRPGLSLEASIAAAIASTAKELVEHRIQLKAPPLFEPDLTAGLCFVSNLKLGGSRLLSTLEAHYRRSVPFMPEAIRNVGSLVLWELDAPMTAVTARKVREQARQLCQTTFDSIQPSQAEAALLVLKPEVLEESKEVLSKLLARAVIICTDKLAEAGALQDLELASRAVADLRRFAREHPCFGFSSEAISMLETLPLGKSPEQRHQRVKIAKFSSLFFAGRQALGGSCKEIGAEDVIAARDMIFSCEGSGCEPLSDYDAEAEKQEETFFDRLMRKFGSSGTTEVPMSIVQVSVRRSRRPDSIPVPTLLDGLARRGRIQIIKSTRVGPRPGGRSTRFVLLPPTPIALPYTPRLALPAPSEQRPLLLPAA